MRAPLRPLLLALLGLLPASAAAQATPPNIIFILSDDQRWDTLAFMPSTLDLLANRGIVFQNAFVTTPVCSPSRASST